jgi:membrane fusion protein (multidrug efflux system)
LKRKLASGELQTVDGDKLRVALTLEDGVEYDDRGSLALTEMSVEPSTGSVTIRAIFPNKGGLLLPGMFVRAQIIEAVRDDAILVAQRAVMRTPAGDAYVFVVNAENKAEQRMIVAERTVGDKWLVSEGLAPGDRVIVEGFQRCRGGDEVKPVDSSLIAEPSRSSATNTSSAAATDNPRPLNQ